MRRFLAIALLLLSGGLSAATVVRTAYCFEPGLCERRPDGSVRGLVVDYLVQLARINDWQFQPVYCSYDEALAKLERGEVDLVGGVTATVERRHAFRFATYATGDCRRHLFVRPDSPCEPGRTDGWNGLEVAIGPDVQARQVLEAFLAERGVSYRLRRFDSAADALTAFLRTEVPAVCALGTADLRSAKILKSFPSVPIYFCTPQQAAGLAKELDTAILRLQSENPGFADRIAARQFPVLPRHEADFTDEERRWLENRVRSGLPVVVDLSPECRPFKWWSEKAGKPVGFVCRLLEEVTRRTGLSFTYLPLTTAARARDRFLRQEAELWASFGTRSKDMPGMREGIRVCSFKPVLVSRAGTSLEKLSDIRLGVPSWNTEQQEACTRAGVKDLVLFDTADGAMKDLLKGRIDAVTMEFSTALLLRQQHHAERLVEFHPTSTRLPYESVFTLNLASTANPCLVSVLRKSIESFTKAEVMALAYRSFMDGMEVPLLTDREWMMIVISVLLVILVVVALSFVFYGRRLSRALVQAKAGERSRTQFLSTMSHEIRTPLNAVIGFAEFLKSPNLAPTDVAGYADSIDRASHVLLDLINDVLDLAKLDSGKVDMRQGVLDFRRLAEDLSDIFGAKAEKGGIRLRFDLPKDPVGLSLSPKHFRQALLNLIGNAVKFTPSGGSVVTAFEASVNPSGTVDVRISVADTGTGMSPEVLPTIFDPFVQDIATRGGHIYEGTGLGLPIVKRIVEAAGGTVEVTSELGKGTTFVLRVPGVACASLPDEGVRPAGPEAPGRLPASVIIVDDVPMNLRVLALHLEKLGIGDVRLAASGKEALAQFAERPAELVLTDMWMPGMSGTDLALRLKACGSPERLRVVAVTADTGSAGSFDMKPFAAVATKPVTREKLLEAFAAGSGSRRGRS